MKAENQSELATEQNQNGTSKEATVVVKESPGDEGEPSGNQ